MIREQRFDELVDLIAEAARERDEFWNRVDRLIEQYRRIIYPGERGHDAGDSDK